MKLKMPDPQPGDGDPEIRRVNDHEITVMGGNGQHLTLSLYNWWRVFGMLAIMLGLPLSKAVGKAIIISRRREMTFHFHTGKRLDGVDTGPP